MSTSHQSDKPSATPLTPVPPRRVYSSEETPRSIQVADSTFSTTLTIATLVIGGLVTLCSRIELGAYEMILLTTSLIEWCILVWSLLSLRMEAHRAAFQHEVVKNGFETVSYMYDSVRFMKEMIEFQTNQGLPVPEDSWDTVINNQKHSMKIERLAEANASLLRVETAEFNMHTEAFVDQFMLCFSLSLLLILILLVSPIALSWEVHLSNWTATICLFGLFLYLRKKREDAPTIFDCRAERKKANAELSAAMEGVAEEQN